MPIRPLPSGIPTGEGLGILRGRDASQRANTALPVIDILPRLLGFVDPSNFDPQRTKFQTTYTRWPGEALFEALRFRAGHAEILRQTSPPTGVHIDVEGHRLNRRRRQPPTLGDILTVESVNNAAD